jgi:hypothetical protein
VTTKSQFSPEEWNSLLSAPTMAALYIALASPGVVDSIKESMAAASAMAKAVQGAPANELMGALMTDFKNMDLLKQAQPKIEMKDPAQVKSQVMALVSQVGNTLEAKAAPAEADYYKHWVYEVAVDAANAAKEGDFLGIGGKRVSDEEAAALKEIATALKVQV